MRFVLTYLFLCCLGGVFSQARGTLKGVIKESSSKEELFGANIFLLNQSEIGASADLNGSFSFSVPAGNHRFVISFVGMKNDTIEVAIGSNEIKTIEVIMNPMEEVLNELIVTAGKFNHKIEDLTISMEVIQPELIQNKNTRSVESVLDQTPGLNILDGEPQIRGGSGFTFGVGSKVAVLVDDMPMLSGDAGRPEWGFVPVENIEQIEVIKGAASVLSGASALSGVIHIKTAEPTLDPLTKFSVYSGMYSSPKDESMQWWDDYPYIHGVNFLHSRKIKNFDVVLGGMMNFDHGYIGAPIADPLVVDTVTNFSDNKMSSEKVRMNFSIRYHPPNAERLVYGISGNAMISNTNMVLAWLNDSSGIYRAYTGGVILQDQTIVNVDPYLSYFSKKGGKHTLKSRLLFTSNEMTNNQSNESKVYYGDYQFKRSYKKLQDLELIAGVSSTFTESEAQLYSGSGSPNNNLLNVSGYSQLEKLVMNKLRVSFGYRAEYYQLNDSITNSASIVRGGLNYKITEGTNVRMSFGQGYRFPTIAERFIKTSVGSFGVFDNPDLVPERSWNMEAGFRQGYKIGGCMGYLDVAVFRQKYINTIEYLFGFWDPSFALAGFKFLNTGRSQVNGIDVSMAGMVSIKEENKIQFIIGYNYILPKTLEPDLIFANDVFGEFSYNNTSLDSTQRLLKYRFKHSFKLDVEYKTKAGFAVGVSARYFSRIENLDRSIEEFETATLNTGGTTQGVLYMDYFNNKNNGNLILDARVSYQFRKLHKIALISSNILNRTFSLRPLKVEPMRTIMLQYSVSI
ncbi:MAG: hypothetical protein CMD01_00010 [Flavobacteriales bacterium]|nr:hypothetical protein [Flavobacteriales bacterium]